MKGMRWILQNTLTKNQNDKMTEIRVTHSRLKVLRLQVLTSLIQAEMLLNTMKMQIQNN